MPQIGEIRYGKEIGLKSHAQFIWHACVNCGKERWVLFLRGKANRLRCRHCSYREHYKNFKGKYVTNDGYVAIYVDSNSIFAPMCNSSGFVHEHRLVMARYLGRCLHSWEDVHHVNGILNDNRLDNLALLPKSVHGKLHRELQLVNK